MVNAAGHHLFVELNSKAYHGISVGNCEIIYYSGSAAGPGVGTVKKPAALSSVAGDRSIWSCILIEGFLLRPLLNVLRASWGSGL